jgi:hypothetical protein
MLKLPAFSQKQFPTGESVTVFQDDSQFWRFYLIPGFPTVRVDANNHPVFQLIKYNLSDQAREADPNLPRGGGYMVFDSELKVKPEHRAEIEKDLKEYVKAEWERIKRLPDDRVRALTLGAAFNDSIGSEWAASGMAGSGAMASPDSHSTMTLNMPGSGFVPPPMDAPAPPVVIGEPLWKSGKVTMNAPQAAGLVTKTIGERPASLIGNNVAAFSIDLTPEGATFMQQTLVGRDGRGATDLTPIQVVYELVMLAKLPPATMFVSFNASSLYHSVHELYHEHDNCSDDYFTSESTMNMAIESGLITIKIDAGGVTDADTIHMLQQQATSMVQELLTKRFADREKPKPDEWGDVSKDSDEVYRLKRETDVDMTNFQETMELSTTTEYKIAPQGTLQAFFTKVQDMTPYVRVVDTNDPFFMTLGLKARAFAKWVEDKVSFVELEVTYGDKAQTFTFTPTAAEPQAWDPALVNGKREFQFRWRVGFEGRAAGDWSKPEKTSTRNLNVAVETPGKLSVEVNGVGLDFANVLDAVLVHLRYEDAARNVPMAGQSLLIAQDRPSGTWTRQLFAQWDKPVEYRLEYLLKSGTTITQDWTKTDGPTQNLLVSRPNVDVLNVTLIPAGQWTDAIQAVLSIRYADGAYQKDAQFNFANKTEFKQWAVLLLHSNQRRFEYKLLATFNNGDVQETAWLAREGDQAVPVVLEGPPRLTVKVIAPGHDFALTPLVKVDLEYADPQGTPSTKSISLQTKDDVGTWSVPIRKDGPRSYRYRISYFPATADPVVRDWQVATEETLTVPRYAIPKIGADFSPVLQDFTLTPAIEINLTYDDPQRNVHERETLVFTTPVHQTWYVPVADTAPRPYQMGITWYFGDGHDTSAPSVTIDKTAVVIPRAPRT